MLFKFVTDAAELPECPLKKECDSLARVLGEISKERIVKIVSPRSRDDSGILKGLDDEILIESEFLWNRALYVIETRRRLLKVKVYIDEIFKGADWALAQRSDDENTKECMRFINDVYSHAGKKFSNNYQEFSDAYHDLLGYCQVNISDSPFDERVSFLISNLRETF